MLHKFNYGMVKKVVLKDNGESVDLYFKYTAETPLYYLNFVGSDMMSDFAKAIANQKAVSELSKRQDLDKLSDINYLKSLPREEQEQLLKLMDTTEYNKFITNFVAALFYTANKDQGIMTFDEIIEEYLPEDFIENKEIMDAVNEILESKVTDKYKKKILEHLISQ